MSLFGEVIFLKEKKTKPQTGPLSDELYLSLNNTFMPQPTVVKVDIFIFKLNQISSFYAV